MDHDAPAGSGKPLPLILARELASNLATPMFLIDARGVLVFYNDAAAQLIGKAFGEMGEIPAEEFGAVLTQDSGRQTASPAGHARRDRILRTSPRPPDARHDRLRRRSAARARDGVPLVRHDRRDARRRVGFLGSRRRGR